MELLRRCWLFVVVAVICGRGGCLRCWWLFVVVAVICGSGGDWW